VGGKIETGAGFTVDVELVVGTTVFAGILAAIAAAGHSVGLSAGDSVGVGTFHTGVVGGAGTPTELLSCTSPTASEDSVRGLAFGKTGLPKPEAIGCAEFVCS